MPDIFNHEWIASLDYVTPFFVFSKRKIADTLNEFVECFPGAIIHYAMKANSEPEVLRTLHEAGSSFEVASAHELDLLREIPVPPENIIYGTSVKAASHIKAFFEYGVDRFAFDSFPEVKKIAAMAPGARVYVRASVDDTGSVFRFSEKFGADKESIAPLLRQARKFGLRPYGISFHVGSQATNPLAWANAINGLAPIIEHLASGGIKFEAINLGGGYPSAYASTEKTLRLKDIALGALKQYGKLPYRPQLILEPGRGIVGDSAILVSTVIARIERRGSPWLFLDAGVYNALYEALPFQGSTRYRVTAVRSSRDCEKALFSLAGPTGDSPDVITREAMLPRAIDVGDRLIFHAVGAYSLAVASRFNGFPKPDVYFVDHYQAC
jgi:ornithine decarboxylase